MKIIRPFDFVEMLLPSALELAFLLYFLGGMVWLMAGWLPLHSMGRRLRQTSEAYDEFVEFYLVSGGFYFWIQSFYVIPGIAAGVIHRSFWGRSFRNLEPAEAERIASEFKVNWAERFYARLMLIHMSTIVSLMIILGIWELLAWALRTLGF